jgi:hypothetical protein
MISSTHSDVQLSPHFWLSEFERSETATRLGLRNEADGRQLANLKRLAGVSEDARVVLGNVPMLPSSGLRTWIVNALVKHIITPDQVPLLDKRPDLVAKCKADTSAHPDGRALDFTAPDFGSPRDIVRRLMDSPLQFDQLIFEGTWVHLGIAREGDTPRRQVLTAVFKAGGKVDYLPGLL